MPKPFFLRPFWRDYVVAYVLIGVGFMTMDFAAINRTGAGPYLSVIAWSMFCGGWIVFVLAVVWPFIVYWRERRAQHRK